VLSASSVSSLREYDNSYAIFMRQAMWVVIGVPLAYVTSRLPRMSPSIVTRAIVPLGPLVKARR